VKITYTEITVNHYHWCCLLPVALITNCRTAQCLTQTHTKCKQTGEQWCAGQCLQLSHHSDCQQERTCHAASAPVSHANIGHITNWNHYVKL